MAEREPKYPWYGTIRGTEPLAQGDFFASCPIVTPPEHIEEGTTPEFRVVTYNVILMSQSCDLVHGKIALVLVCPVFSYREIAKAYNYLASSKGRENLRQGLQVGYHLLNKCELPGFERDYSVVDFRNVYGVPFGSLVSLAEKEKRRLRLLPPYREHLSQAFARFFMRVGLPIDIPNDFV